MSVTSQAPVGSAAAKYDLLLQQFALGFPEAVEEAPWGHRALKVRGKTFLFLVADADGLSLSMKLPTSAGFALMAPFCEPTGYGLGKTGWVTARFGVKETPPLEDLRLWIEESYRAIAPKLLTKLLDDQAEAEPAPKQVAKQQAKPAATKAAKQAASKSSKPTAAKASKRASKRASKSAPAKAPAKAPGKAPTKAAAVAKRAPAKAKASRAPARRAKAKAAKAPARATAKRAPKRKA